MFIKVSVLCAYFLIILVIGFIARTRWKSSPETYFLADRKLGPLILMGTMVATNFSAFTVFGTSGAGYRDGYAFFPIMGFGTGFMALTFWIIGRKIRLVGRKHALVTPPELVKDIISKPFSVLPVCRGHDNFHDSISGASTHGGRLCPRSAFRSCRIFMAALW